jgi:hypothetical protein
MNERWIYAGVVITTAIAAGALAGWGARRVLQKPDRRSELHQVADSAAAFLFWFITSLGIVIAVGLTAPGSFDHIPALVLTYLPRVLVAGLTLIGGYAVAIATSVVLGRGLARATGRSRRQVTTALRGAVVGAAALMALRQLGVDTTIITVTVAALVFGAVAALALLVGFGGKDMAREIAAGRYLKRILQPGDEVAFDELRGTVAAIHPVTLELQTTVQGRVHVANTRVLANALSVRRAEEKSARKDGAAIQGARRSQASPEAVTPREGSLR